MKINTVPDLPKVSKSKQRQKEYHKETFRYAYFFSDDPFPIRKRIKKKISIWTKACLPLSEVIHIRKQLNS